jgi:DNA replication protein DnaC
LGHQACRHGWTTLSLRVPRGLQARPIAKGDGRSPPLLAAFAKTERLLLDDWGLVPCSAEHRRDILERLEERHGRRATMITRQFPVDHWHEAMGEPTLADAILDRVLHHAYKIALRGESRRKRQIPMPNAMNAM